ncbi:cupin domain-containing protein [Gramella jeungdoensis]|uniref:Cupin domain-containing protein n=1 Tax=Gramella jeungdoensis TaxID=708091 RepID=A0ABT0Z4R7_9FLAO|nr:cupin domain-containing protein [Gramella jeungdoensis]MCM8570132.1 cupin domain-containing protein [Gramella jeungdoensis]
MKSLKIIKESEKVFLSFLILLFMVAASYAQDGKQKEKSTVVDHKDTELNWGGCPDFMPNGCNIAILHGDPASNNADILFKVPANSDIPLHWHNSAERMILISGEMEVTYEGESTQILKVGSYGYGPAKKPHTAKCKDKGPCILFIAFEKPVDAFAGNGK